LWLPLLSFYYRNATFAPFAFAFCLLLLLAAGGWLLAAGCWRGYI
jgi:hypothetical protein